MVTLKQIQKNLAEAINTSNITQSELARRLNIGQSNISHYIKGNKMPALDTLANLCKIIDISPAYILCYEDESGSKI
ncbi:MAG: helix-turn-helix domain-containing protein [Clostridia bacterium]|nr:helix-turn-helix domain-containing protein [Clostridia bacterium]